MRRLMAKPRLHLAPWASPVSRVWASCRVFYRSAPGTPVSKAVVLAGSSRILGVVPPALSRFQGCGTHQWLKNSTGGSHPVSPGVGRVSCPRCRLFKRERAE